MTKRTAPSLVLALALVLAASGPAFATRGNSTSIPEVITVSDVSIRIPDQGLTEVTIHGDFPLNYLVYQPDRNKLVLEVRDCDASMLDVDFPTTSSQVMAFEAEVAEDADGAAISRFKFDLAPRVSHTIAPDGNDLLVSFTGGLDLVEAEMELEKRIDQQREAAAVRPAPAPVVVPASIPRQASPAPAANANGLINFTRTDAAGYAQEAGVPALPVARALVGIDTSMTDRVVMMLDGPASFSTFELANPARLVVDLEDVANEVTVASIPVDSSLVRQVRVSQFKNAPEQVARGVFDLSGSVTYEVMPTSEGLEVSFQRAVLPQAPAMEIARASEPLPDTSDPQSTDNLAEPVQAPEPVAVAMADVPEMIPQESGDTLDTDDYAFYSMTDPEAEAPTATGGVKEGPALIFESKTISGDRPTYTGRRISFEFVDADLKQIFRLFHEISGLNFVLDPSVDGKVTIVLDNVPWDQALDIILRNNGLDKIFDNNVMRIATTGKLAQEAQNRRALKEASRLEVDPVTVSRTLSYAQAPEVDAIIRRILSPRGESFYDTRTNTVVITDIPEMIEATDKLMDDLDARTPQVMIEARIVETSREFVRDLGINWGILANDQRGANNAFSGSWDLNLPRVAGASALGLGWGDPGPDGFTIDIALDFLETEGRARVLSAPKVVAQNNSAAIIEQGVQIPVVSTTATEINVEFISASLKLEVTPQITAEGTVIMDIKVDNSSPDFKNTVDDTPSIITERAVTRVLVEDGGTTVIGGVFLLNEGESDVGIPYLRKIPGLGWLFRSRNITKQNKELLIFITPKITL